MALSGSRPVSVVRFLLAAAVGLALITCGDGPTEPVIDRTPVTLVVSQQSVTLVPGDSALTWAEARDRQSALVIATVTWSSTDALVASVTNGRIRALAPGTAKVVATLGQLADTVDVTVLPAITATQLSVLGATLTSIGDRAELLAKSLAGTEAREGRYTFAVRDNTLLSLEEAHVWGSAFVKALAAGATWVVAAERGGTMDSVLVTVDPSPLRLAFATETLRGFVGRTLVPQLTGIDARGNTVTSPRAQFRVLDTSVARPTDGGVELRRVGFTRVEAISDVGSHAFAELEVFPYPKLEAVVVTDGWFDDPVPLATGQTVQGSISGGPLFEPVLQATVLGDPAVTAAASTTSGLTLTGVQAGSSQVVVSSALMQSDTLSVRVTRARIHLRDFALPAMVVGATLSPAIRAADSLDFWRPFPADIPVTITSSDSTIVRVAPASREVTLAATSDNYIGVQLQGIAAGTARVTASAPGFVAAERDYIVTAAPLLQVQPSSEFMGAGQTTRGPSFGGYGTPWRIAASDRSTDIQVTLSHSNPAVAATPAQVALGPMYLYNQFDVDALAPGVDTIVAAAPGFVPDTVILTVTSPRFLRWPDGVQPTDTLAGGFEVQVGDTTGRLHAPLADLEIVAESSDSTVLIPGSSTVPAGFHARWGIPFTFVDTGTADITLKDKSGAIPPMTVTMRVLPDRTLGVVAALADDAAAIGVRQRFVYDLYAVVDFFFASEPVEVTYASTDMAVLPAAGTLTIPPGQNSAIIPLPPPTAPGTARIVVSAPKYVTDTSAAIDVGIPRLVFARHPATVSVQSTDSVRVMLTDHRGRARVTDVPVTFTVSAGSGLAPIEATIDAGASQASIVVVFTDSGELPLVAQETGTSVGYAPDTVPVRVLAIPKRLGVPAIATIGVGQLLPVNVTREGFGSEAITVSMMATSGRVSAPASVSFAASSGLQAATLRGASTGVDTIVVSSPGYVSDSLRIVVTDGRLKANGLGTTPKVGTAYNVTIAATDSAATPRAVAVATTFSIAGSEGVSVTNADGTPITSVTIAAGETTSAPFVVKATAAGAQKLLISRLDYVPLTLNVTAAP